MIPKTQIIIIAKLLELSIRICKKHGFKYELTRYEKEPLQLVIQNKVLGKEIRNKTEYINDVIKMIHNNMPLNSSIITRLEYYHRET